MDIRALEELRHTCGVTLEEMADLAGCSHFTYTKLRRGVIPLEPWQDSLQLAERILQIGLDSRVLPIIHVERRQEALRLLADTVGRTRQEARERLQSALELAKIVGG